MKSDELIAELSRRPPRNTFSRSNAIVAGAALLSLIAALALSILWLEPRSDLAVSLFLGNHFFLLKLLFTVGVAASVVPIVCDLCVPGRRVKSAYLWVTIPFAVIMFLAVRELAGQQVGKLGNDADESLLDCLWQIPILAAPAFVIMTLAVRRLAPTDLRRTGAYIGLLAGGIGAVGYALHCHHDSAAFVGIAYTIAISEVAIIGSLLGPRLLRWA